MSDEEARAALESAKVKCIRCGAVWVTSLEVEWINCLRCEQRLEPKKHGIVTSEAEVN